MPASKYSYTRSRSSTGGVTHTKTKNKKTGLVTERTSVRLGNNTTRSTSSTGKKRTRSTW